MREVLELAGLDTQFAERMELDGLGFAGPNHRPAKREAATDADHDADERYTRADLEAMAMARSSTWRPKPDTPQTKSMAWTRRS